jgi:Beta-galactosidase
VAIRLRRSIQPINERWAKVPVEPAHSTRLGFSFRPRQAEAFGLDPMATLDALLALPFTLVRLGAYWDRIEPEPAAFSFEELDAQIAAIEDAGKQIILGLGAIKQLGYPEFFVPAHRLQGPLEEGIVVTPSTHAPLLAAATSFLTRLIERYRDRAAIIAWQVEHEAVDPLGFEHSWRLGTRFVEAEIGVVRRADPGRPLLLNGYWPLSVLEAMVQRFRTRDQGDSLKLAQSLADIVGIDAYPSHALLRTGPLTLYLDRRGAWPRDALARAVEWSQTGEKRIMISEGQAEPWEAITTPPNPAGGFPSSCPPDRLIQNYNQASRWAVRSGLSLFAYLFWGAEYWILRERSGDPRYVRAASRILAQSQAARVQEGAD